MSARRGRGARDNTLSRKLAKLGLHSRLDFVLHLPLRYEDETVLTPVDKAPADRPVCVEAKLTRAEVAYRPRRQLVVHAEGLVLRFFNFYPSQLKQFQQAIEKGKRVRAYGEIRSGWFGAEMAHPRYRVVGEGEPLPTTLTPVYPTTAGLSQAELRPRVIAALDESPVDDTLPEPLRERHRLPALAQSLELLHRPPPGVDPATLEGRTHPAWRRVKFDELLAQQLSMRIAYRRRRERAAPALRIDGPLLSAFLKSLPFALTVAQQRVMREILQDLSRPHPMQRLLQGDVGSGKTILAALGCLAAVDSGLQAAVMAPTELLAEQHFRKFVEWLSKFEVQVLWLHGGLSRREKKTVLDALGGPWPKIVIGTHALVQEGVDFARLGLAVVDEQHRFGVHQRLTLRNKGGSVESLPHQLMMSATPIPRTLSMTYYADLDVSTLDELPPGRRPVATRLVSAARRAEVLARIRDACAEGQQAYWVCPVIEQSPEDEAQAAVATYEGLARELRGLRAGLLHGRLPAQEKAATMQRFASGELQLLVATTVIEVGVDVPNASLMVIESAERFGLSQLHQLRGRVGRGSRESVCILLYGAALSETARERLKIIYEHADGFEVARRDLELRGPGELLGERQSGAPMLRFAELERDGDLVEAARAAAAEMLERHPVAAHAHVERWLGARRDLSNA